MTSIVEKFRGLGIDNAPGQEVGRGVDAASGFAMSDVLPGPHVDFSHGDVGEDAFEPTPGAFEAFAAGFRRGGTQAYTEYRGDAGVRTLIAERLGMFTGIPVEADEELIITPGTQSALFLAVSAIVAPGDKVAIVQPDYFANRKLVAFVGGQAIPVQMDYLDIDSGAGLDLTQLEAAFRSGAKAFLFSNPNNPTGVVYSPSEIASIVHLANAHGATVIVDQLYSRLLYPGHIYTQLCASGIDPQLLVTIMGPSKTESLSGFRLGVAFGASKIIERMEKLQAIVSLRAPGYCQAVLQTWFSEPSGWLPDRIARHQSIRDDLLTVFNEIEGAQVRMPDAGSYLFPKLPPLSIEASEFVRLLRAQAGVIVTPGTEFSPDETESIRLNFSQNHARAVQGATRITALSERYRSTL